MYGAYTECEALYQLDRMYALWNSLDEADQRDFNMDPMSIDWPHYAHDIQLPSTVKQARLKMQPSRGPSVDRNERLRNNVLSEDRHLAVFDLENTLIASNVVASYSWLATRHLDSTDRLRFTLKTLREAPTLWNLDRSDRSDFLRYFYRRFEDAPIDRLDDDALEMMSDLLITKSFPAGIRRVRAHRALGHKTLLITGALDVVVEPLRPLFDHIVSAELGAHDGAYDGKLTNVPPTGEARYQALADYAKEHDLDLEGVGCLRRLDIGSADARSRRVPRRRQRRDQTRRHRPSSWMADRALDQVRRRPQPHHSIGRAPCADPAQAASRRHAAAPPAEPLEFPWHLTPKPFTRPGFVLNVDKQTPPLLFHHGDNFRLEKLPADRTRVIYSAEPLPGLPDPEAAIRHALLEPIDDDPLPELLKPGMKLTIAFDDISLPLPPCGSPTFGNASSSRSRYGRSSWCR